jgi:hypothetical protein
MDFVDIVIEESKWNTSTYVNGKFEFVKRRYPPHLCTPSHGNLDSELVIHNRILNSDGPVHIVQVFDNEA